MTQEDTRQSALLPEPHGTSPPREVEGAPARAAEFVICDHTIEESFRDDTSGGFDLEASHLSDPKRLDTLLLALSVAVLWISELGAQVLREDRRSEVDPAYKRQLSVFQLG